MVYVLAVSAALANALCSILQRMGVEDAPTEDTMHLSLLTHALKRGIWLAGFGLMIGSFLLQAVALHLGDLSEVQPILTFELVFLVLILATWFRFRVGLREWVGAFMAAAGLSGFLYFASPTPGPNSPTAMDWIVCASVCGVIVLLCVTGARRGPRWWRAAMYGSAAAITYAFTAALIKVVSDVVANDWVAMFWHWETYGLAVTGLTAVFLTQNAYHSGPIGASQSTLVLVDPMASIVIGIVLFGDILRTQSYYGPLEALSLLVMFAGVVWLSQSPLVAGMKGDEDASADLLSTRSRSQRLADKVADQLGGNLSTF